MIDIDLNRLRFDGKSKFSIDEAVTHTDLLYEDKKDYRKKINALRDAIDERQRMMYAHNRYSLLVVFQAMDAAGKDSTIRAVFSGVNPHGVRISSFKRPTSKELDHNFLWRTTVAMPERGHIGVFNRSYYEEVLVCKVHPEILTDFQKMPDEATRDIDKLFMDRYDAIRAFERYSADNGTLILKFFLNISKEEQKNRFLSRIDEPHKNWKFSEADIKERGYWDDYQRAYEEAINQTATPYAKWHVIPADDKRSMRLMVGAAVLEAFDDMDMEYPELDDAQQQALQGYRTQLLEE